MIDWLTQETTNELDSRRRNEWIEQTTERFGGGDGEGDYVCECSDASCTVLITLSRDEYESVRKYGTHFAIAINHENPLIDRVIGENERFAVVQKWLGLPRRMADESNPRL